MEEMQGSLLTIENIFFWWHVSIFHIHATLELPNVMEIVIKVSIKSDRKYVVYLLLCATKIREVPHKPTILLHLSYIIYI